ECSAHVRKVRFGTPTGCSFKRDVPDHEGDVHKPAIADILIVSASPQSAGPTVRLRTKLPCRTAGGSVLRPAPTSESGSRLLRCGIPEVLAARLKSAAGQDLKNSR